VKETAVITEPLPAPVFGRDGEPCPACGAPLAGDQRYCLHCGRRRPEARLEFLDVLDADVRLRGLPAVLPVAAAPAGERRGLNARLQANSGALALAGLMLLTLLIGLLLGHWASARAPQAASAPAPQVIRLDGAAAATPAAGTPAAGGGSGGTPTAARKPAAKTPKDAVPVQQVGGAKAIEKAVKKGKPIATGGAPLPKDNKPAGGGSSFQTIG
jgi:hypothetical protein